MASSLDMASVKELQMLLDSASVAPTVFALCPDYRAVLVVADGIAPGPSDEASEALLKDAEAFARKMVAATPVTQLPHVAAWREAYKAFGTNPNKFRNSPEALTRRITPDSGLPRVNRLTDIYNAISVRYQIPLGGEDLAKYEGSPRLIRATGKEDFYTKTGGELTTEHPNVGEIVWTDSSGVTCRRWNWRQGPRTALTDETTTALFICDALDAMNDEELTTAVSELIKHLKRLGPDVSIEQRVLKAPLE